MRIGLSIDLTRDEGRNYSAEEVASAVVQQVETELGEHLFMDDASDTRYRINFVTVTSF